MFYCNQKCQIYEKYKIPNTKIKSSINITISYIKPIIILSNNKTRNQAMCPTKSTKEDNKVYKKNQRNLQTAGRDSQPYSCNQIAWLICIISFIYSH